MRKALLTTLILCFAISAFGQERERKSWGRDAVRWGQGAIDTPSAETYFVSTWKTDNAGTSGDSQILLPLTADPVNIYVDWGDGNYNHINDYTDARKTHTYPAAGTYTVKIYGTLKGFRFANLGDKRKITDISQWGCFDLTTDQVFYGCENLECTATDAPIVSSTIFYNQFKNCGILTNLGKIEDWVFTDVTNFESCFMYAHVFDQDLSLSHWATAPTNFRNMFYDSDAYDYSLASWLIGSLTDAAFMFHAAPGMTTVNYSATLISWAAQAAQPNVPFKAGNATFTGGTLVTSAATATTADKLVDGTQDFSFTGLDVQIGDVVYNTTDGTWARVTGVDNATTLSIDVDIMVNGEGYKILQSAAAKAKAALVIDDGWVIIDGGIA